MKKKYAAYTCTALITLLLLMCGWGHISRKKTKGHWEWYKIAEYEFRQESVQAEISQWIDSLHYINKENADNSKRMDFDFCYLSWSDTVWNARQTEPVDSFNVRLHTHNYCNNYLRPDNFTSLIKGCCQIGQHTLLLYDDTTIKKCFVSRNRKRHFLRHVQDERGFLDWRDEDAWVAHIDKHLRPINDSDIYFYRHNFLFYDPTMLPNKLYLAETIDADTFAIRSTGPYLILEEDDEMSSEKTEENILRFIRDNLTQEEVATISKNTRITIYCKVDSLGRATFQNYVTLDVADAIDRVCLLLPDFQPAKERGKSVNSVVCYSYYLRDFCH